MVNRLHTMRDRVVKAERADSRLPRVTSKGGLALAQALARRLRLWSDVEASFPARKDSTQGFQMTACVASLVHGLLAGGRGFSATEAMREDAPLLRTLGFDAAPSAETVEEAVKFVALEREGSEATNRALNLQAVRTLSRMSMGDLKTCGGFVPFWADGSFLEVEGKRFDSIKWIGGKKGQIVAAAFCGPVLTGLDFANEGEGELTVALRLIEEAVKKVLRPLQLADKALFLLDSLYGNGPALDRVESLGASYVVGVSALDAAEFAMRELPESRWQDTGANERRGWAASGAAEGWLQCAEWPEKRAMVCRRWRKKGEMIWNYAGVATNLSVSDARVARLMSERGESFAEVVWKLYDRKQAMENQWKDMLVDLGLHHPPSAKARVNAVFYGIAGLAYNLAVGVRQLALAGSERLMRLWRLRREVFDLAALAVHHGRTVVVRYLDARDHLVKQLLAAMQRLARL